MVALNSYQLDLQPIRPNPPGNNPPGKNPPGKNPPGKNPAPGMKDDTRVVRAFQDRVGPCTRSRKRGGSRRSIDDPVARARHNLRDAASLTRKLRGRLASTPVQLGRVADLEDEAADLASLVSGSDVSFSTRDDALRRLRDRLDARTYALFTPEQSAKWKELIGDPYTGFVKTLIRGPILRTRPANPWGLQ